MSTTSPPATTTTDAVTTTARAAIGATIGDAVSDTIAVAQRNLIGLVRTPTTLVFATVQPIIFVLMFRYVFGGSIHVPGYRHYVDFLMPGIFVQTVTFGAMNTGIGLATDLQTGLIERFRSLPMARSAVLAGRALADLVRNLGVVILMVAMGFLVGFRIHTNVLGLLASVALMLFFGLAISWVVALIGLATGNAEAAQAAMFPLTAVFVFASSSFVNPATMPGPLKAFARHQPVSATVNAVRALTHGGPTAERVGVALLWAVAITIAFAALSTRRYRRVA